MGGIAKMGGNTETATPAKAEPLGGDLAGQTYYQDKLCVEEEECTIPDEDEFTIAILGDLHLDPRKMEDYYAGRDHFLPILEDAKSRGVATALVSLGDLGESKSVRPEETQELFAGIEAGSTKAAKTNKKTTTSQKELNDAIDDAIDKQKKLAEKNKITVESFDDLIKKFGQTAKGAAIHVCNLQSGPRWHWH